MPLQTCRCCQRRERVGHIERDEAKNAGDAERERERGRRPRRDVAHDRSMPFCCRYCAKGVANSGLTCCMSAGICARKERTNEIVSLAVVERERRKGGEKDADAPCPARACWHPQAPWRATSSARRRMRPGRPSGARSRRAWRTTPGTRRPPPDQQRRPRRRPQTCCARSGAGEGTA